MILAPVRALLRSLRFINTLVLGAALLASCPAPAQTPLPRTLVPSRPPPGLGLEHGALIIHGNYCGPGDRGWGLAPIDALDAACLRHDVCAPPFGTALPSCACNARLFGEATAVANNLATPLPVRVTAAFVARTATMLACRP